MPRRAFLEERGIWIGRLSTAEAHLGKSLNGAKRQEAESLCADHWSQDLLVLPLALSGHGPESALPS